jgi:hypothetical protein
MVKDNNINTGFTSYIDEKLMLNPLFPSDTNEDKWNKVNNVMYEASSNTLKRNLPDPKQPWINYNIISEKKV